MHASESTIFLYKMYYVLFGFRESSPYSADSDTALDAAASIYSLNWYDVNADLLNPLADMCWYLMFIQMTHNCRMACCFTDDDKHKYLDWSLTLNIKKDWE